MLNTEDLLDLPASERIELACRLLDSVVSDDVRTELSPAWQAELERRLKDIEDNPDDESSWEEVRERLRAKFG